SYGVAERLISEGNQIHMCAFYIPGREGIEYTGRIPNVIQPASMRYPFSARSFRSYFSRLYGAEVERPMQPLDIEISEDDEPSNPSSYPVTMERLDAIKDQSKREIVRAKFIIGTDWYNTDIQSVGAHSWVRKALGIETEVDQTGCIWGVVDMVPETNFPDIRNSTDIRSEGGSCKIIPREVGRSRKIYSIHLSWPTRKRSSGRFTVRLFRLTHS
ncbi:hypothetical protein EV363DRAFT_1150194, partial [Boletus edulis]